MYFIPAFQFIKKRSVGNKDQKLVSHYLKMGYFIGYYIDVPLKMYGKFG